MKVRFRLSHDRHGIHLHVTVRCDTAMPREGSLGMGELGGRATAERRPRLMSGAERPLPRGDRQVSLSAFSFLFSEIVQYARSGVKTTQDLETKLERLGEGVGVRMLELAFLREKPGRRETRAIGILQFIHTTVWTILFGKAADELQRSTESEDEYMVNEADPLVNKFISVPREMGSLNCAAFVAGVIKGVLDGAGFPAAVNAHSVPSEGQPRRTMFLIKFEPQVLERERALGAS